MKVNKKVNIQDRIHSLHVGRQTRDRTETVYEDIMHIYFVLWLNCLIGNKTSSSIRQPLFGIIISQTTDFLFESSCGDSGLRLKAASVFIKLFKICNLTCAPKGYAA